jgi:hypothetical protein
VSSAGTCAATCVLYVLTRTLQNLQFATKARKGVENARLNLDATKAKAKGGAAFSMPGQKQHPVGEENLSEEARVEIEAAEDEFVGQTEEAVGVMKNVGRAVPISRADGPWIATICHLK